MRCIKMLEYAETKDYIEKKLEELETDKEIKIIFAIESGSRIWGFSSEDSDYDVRFVYTHEYRESYYNLFKKAQPQIEDSWLHRKTNKDIDVVGWELRKFLTLLYKSNCTALEWLVSPILYTVGREATWSRLNYERKRIMKFAYPTIDYHAVFKHYISMAKSNYKKYIDRYNYEDDKVPAKKYLYVLRGILASAYVSMKRELPILDIIDLAGNTIPHLLNKMGITKSKYALKKLEQIIELKNDTEQTMMRRDAWIDAVIDTYFDSYEYEGEELNPPKDERAKRDKAYNEYFRGFMWDILY